MLKTYAYAVTMSIEVFHSSALSLSPPYPLLAHLGSTISHSVPVA